MWNPTAPQPAYRYHWESLVPLGCHVTGSADSEDLVGHVAPLVKGLLPRLPSLRGSSRPFHSPVARDADPSWTDYGRHSPFANRPQLESRRESASLVRVPRAGAVKGRPIARVFVVIPVAAWTGQLWG